MKKRINLYAFVKVLCAALHTVHFTSLVATCKDC
uniref:Uncharacterized protein n=1 Tax=Rhizophora mucronata TaxID=61149 RepID=A0A2P2N067_RHIMU